MEYGPPDVGRTMVPVPNRGQSPAETDLGGTTAPRAVRARQTGPRSCRERPGLARNRPHTGCDLGGAREVRPKATTRTGPPSGRTVVHR